MIKNNNNSTTIEIVHLPYTGYFFKSIYMYHKLNEVRSSLFGQLFYVTTYLKIVHHILIIFVYLYFTVPNKPNYIKLLIENYIYI